MRASSLVLPFIIFELAGFGFDPLPAAGGTSTYKTTVLGDRPAAYYQLDEYAPGGAVANRTALTDSAFQNAGYYLSSAPNGITRTGGLTAKDIGGDTAAQFSPNGFAATRNYFQLHFGTMTIEAWVAWKTLPGGVIASFGNAGNAPFDNYKLAYDTTGAKFVYQIAVGGSPHTLGAVSARPNVVYHVVGTFDGGMQRLYVNGVLRAAQTLHGAIGGYDSRSTFGFNVANDSTHQHPASAVIDEVALYPAALSAARIAAHYLAGSTIAPYTIRALGNGGPDASMGGLNEVGDVAGAENEFAPGGGPSVYSGGRVIRLGPSGSFALAINDRGSVLLDRGSDGLYRCATVTKACVHLTPLPLSCPENNPPFVAPGGLNNADTVVAWEQNVLCSAPIALQAVQWNAAGVPSLVFPPGAATFTQAYAINDAGTILGGITSSSALAFAPALQAQGTLKRLPFLKFSTTIKNNGDVLGSIYRGCAYGLIRHDGYAFDVPIVPIAAATTQMMNSLDQAVGFGQLPSCQTDATGSISAAGETQPIPLSSLIPAQNGWTQLNPVAINDHGQIAGFGMFRGAHYVFLMSPNPK